MSAVKRVHVCSAEMLKLITQRLRRSEQWSCPHQLKALQHTHTALTEREDRLNILSFRIWHSLAHFLLQSSRWETTSENMSLNCPYLHGSKKKKPTALWIHKLFSTCDWQNEMPLSQSEGKFLHFILACPLK